MVLIFPFKGKIQNVSFLLTSRKTNSWPSFGSGRRLRSTWSRSHTSKKKNCLNMSSFLKKNLNTHKWQTILLALVSNDWPNSSQKPWVQPFLWTTLIDYASLKVGGPKNIKLPKGRSKELPCHSGSGVALQDAPWPGIACSLRDCLKGRSALLPRSDLLLTIAMASYLVAMAPHVQNRAVRKVFRSSWAMCDSWAEGIM